MTDQSTSAAERSAHVHRGDAPSPADWPVVRMPDGAWKLKSVVALENRIAELESENADLSANQCLHNIHGDEAGNPYCPRIAELEEELSIWRSVFPNKAEAAARIAELEKAVVQSRLLTKLMKPQADRIAELEAALRNLDDMIVDLDAGHIELHQVSRFINGALAGWKR